MACAHFNDHSVIWWIYRPVGWFRIGTPTRRPHQITDLVVGGRGGRLKAGDLPRRSRALDTTVYLHRDIMALRIWCLWPSAADGECPFVVAPSRQSLLIDSGVLGDQIGTCRIDYGASVRRYPEIIDIHWSAGYLPRIATDDVCSPDLCSASCALEIGNPPSVRRPARRHWCGGANRECRPAISRRFVPDQFGADIQQPRPSRWREREEHQACAIAVLSRIGAMQ
ncbi:hypothetical protein SAMN05518866_105186 [Sphingobium sp. YR768]|nr:hypothetical protein SAMN05518866_105186 [Sphingobium sp. YR768]